METDDRFKGIATDPRFRTLPSRLKKVKIDDRFKGMFNDRKFKVKSAIDERGRPLRLSSTKHLKKFYELSSDEEQESDDDAESVKEAESDDAKEEITDEYYNANEAASTSASKVRSTEGKLKKKKEGQPASRVNKEYSEKEACDEEDVSDSEDDNAGIKPEVDYARGAVLESDSSEESDDDDTQVVPYDQEAHDDHYWGEQDNDAEMTENITNRLAIINMDWDRIKACDLLLLLNSFKPSAGVIHTVKIYPSEYGKERMKEDDVIGPKELKNAKLTDTGDALGKLKSLDEKDQKKALQENLRQYQLNRLKYFYAVAVCDTPETADHIYTNCDGREYLASCTQLDLRYIPDEMEFDEGEVKDSASHIPENYEPRFFINQARGQTLVQCTWDETVPDRTDKLNKKYSKEEIEQADLEAYLAVSASEGSDSESSIPTCVKSKEKPDLLSYDKGSDDNVSASESDGEEGDIQKYRQLLLGSADDKDEEDDVDMEIEWDTGLKEATEDLISKMKKDRDSKNLTVFEKQHQKNKEKHKVPKVKHGDTIIEDDKKRVTAKNKTISEKSGTNKEPIKQGQGYIQAFSDDELPDGHIPDFADSEQDEPQKEKSKTKKKSKKLHRKIDSNLPKDSNEKANLDMLVMEDKTHKHFNMKDIVEYDNMTKSKRKRKIKKNELKNIEDNFQIDVTDERFSALYSSHLYNIDPSSQDYRKTKSMEALIKEKQRRIVSDERTVEPPTKKKLNETKKKSDQLQGLVKSIKAKTVSHNSQRS